MELQSAFPRLISVHVVRVTPKQILKTIQSIKNHYAFIVTNKTKTKKQPVVKQKYKCQNKFTKNTKMKTPNRNVDQALLLNTTASRKPRSGSRYISQKTRWR